MLFKLKTTKNKTKLFLKLFILSILLKSTACFRNTKQNVRNVNPYLISMQNLLNSPQFHLNNLVKAIYFITEQSFFFKISRCSLFCILSRINSLTGDLRAAMIRFKWYRSPSPEAEWSMFSQNRKFAAC